jgi:hypothetical protein
MGAADDGRGGRVAARPSLFDSALRRRRVRSQRAGRFRKLPLPLRLVVATSLLPVTNLAHAPPPACFRSIPGEANADLPRCRWRKTWSCHPRPRARPLPMAPQDLGVLMEEHPIKLMERVAGVMRIPAIRHRRQPTLPSARPLQRPQRTSLRDRLAARPRPRTRQPTQLRDRLGVQIAAAVAVRRHWGRFLFAVLYGDPPGGLAGWRSSRATFPPVATDPLSGNAANSVGPQPPAGRAPTPTGKPMSESAHASDCTHDLSQLRRSQRGLGLPQWVFCNFLSVRGYSPGRPNRSASMGRSLGVSGRARAQLPGPGGRRDVDARSRGAVDPGAKMDTWPAMSREDVDVVRRSAEPRFDRHDCLRVAPRRVNGGREAHASLARAVRERTGGCGSAIWGTRRA